ncbi:tyrosine-type recombinase/integrase [Desulfobulbus rhabdoformis]|uniref:tyrosine-type recombinase/integrase n=1 Tax=Desulfobulbus rhabdoformis TaxID=34032 RepID=UPI00196636C7|nr:site-specific integrase [Desulfobulbus rhabdoformis]MBM9616643.1 tyrosine-type recombinase/integrase [Desulfobulbus rhabdoformis]
MAREEVNFTKASLEQLEAPEPGKRRYVYDSKESGLLVQVTGNGRKTFQLYKKHMGKPVRVTIGTFPELTVEQARKKAKAIKVELINGENPNDKLKQQRQEMTFADLFHVYLERHAKPRKKTWQEDETYFKRHLSALGKKRLSTITKGDVAAIHSRIGKDKPTHANRVLALISSIIGRGIEYGLYEGQNPCAGIRRFPEQSRDRFLTADELQRFFLALEQEPNGTARDFFLVALLTGARRANVLSMRWSDIDLKGQTWRIPETKNGTPQTVPLVGPLLEILQELRKSTSSFFVFPGRGKTGHLVEPKKAWKRICQSAGIEGVRIHDLRRTMGSWQAKTGASLPVIGKSLNHKSASTTTIYARLDLDPVRTAMEKAAEAMLEAGGNGKK